MLTRQKSVNSILQSGMTVLAQSSVTAFSFLQSISDQRAGKQTIWRLKLLPSLYVVHSAIFCNYIRIQLAPRVQVIRGGLGRIKQNKGIYKKGVLPA